jgi:hypothetical protein
MKKLLAQAKTELEIALLDIKKFSALRSKSLPFNTNDLSEKYINEIILPKIKGDNQVIYIFKLKRKLDLISTLEKYKNNHKNNKLPQINHNSTSKVLYVGSVLSNFKGRIKQHLGFGSKSTYSLKLGKWAIKEKLDIVIEYFVLENTSSVITLRLIENILANSLKPQFGKHDKIKTK